MRTRCAWAESGDALYVRYHDEEWGAPVVDDTLLFEFLLLEGTQAGLSWRTILNKRENYRLAFAEFNAARVARFDERQVIALLQNEGIIRNRLKVAAAITNAAKFLEIQREFGSFSAYQWQFVGNRPIQNNWHDAGQIPAISAEATALSSDLKRRGFKFVGPTIIYAHMQAVGMVNDHTTNCFRHDEVRALGERLKLA